MDTKIFVNLPVRDLAKSMAFFRQLGFDFDSRFTNDKGACLVIGENIYAMLLVEEFFQAFTKKGVCDAAKCTEVIVALAVDSRAKADELADKALAAGGKYANDPMDEGVMYGRSFQDPDGHQWEVFYMEPAAAK